MLKYSNGGTFDSSEYTGGYIRRDSTPLFNVNPLSITAIIYYFYDSLLSYCLWKQKFCILNITHMLLNRAYLNLQKLNFTNAYIYIYINSYSRIIRDPFQKNEIHPRILQTRFDAFSRPPFKGIHGGWFDVSLFTQCDSQLEREEEKEKNGRDFAFFRMRLHIGCFVAFFGNREYLSIYLSYLTWNILSYLYFFHSLKSTLI